MKKVGFASALAAIAYAEQALELEKKLDDLLDIDQLNGKDMIEPVKTDYSNVAPIALLHGVGSGCNDVTGWVDMIS